ncbi:hypothetical protein AN161_02185 [Lysinibacillus sp. FJAT-14222]|nr:hypothetical protein AN161_02185 [Lysinibacillus sp. FJAT-14222]
MVLFINNKKLVPTTLMDKNYKIKKELLLVLVYNKISFDVLLGNFKEAGQSHILKGGVLSRYLKKVTLWK